MLRKTFLEGVLKKGGMTDAEITETLGDLTGDFADDRATAVVAALMTEDEAAASDTINTKVKRTAKAEALDGLDTILKTYEGKLSAAQKTEYGKLGKDSYKKSQFLLTAFDAKGTQTGDEAAIALQTELDELKANTVSKTDYDQISGQVTAAQKRAIQSEIISAARTNPLLRDVNGDRHFGNNLTTDVNALIESGIAISDKVKVKAIVDQASGRLMKAEKPEEPVLINGRAATIADAVDQAIKNEALGWGKKSDGTPSGTVQLPADQKNVNISKAAQRNLDDDD